MSKKYLEPIAVIGIGAIMPGALNKDEFWQNITAGKNCIIEVPQDRWDPALFYDADHSAKDKTYSKIGGFITGFKFNAIKYRIPPNIAKQMDNVQQLALETTAMALEDAGYDKKDFARARTAVIIANAMGGSKNEYSCTRIYKQFYYDMLRRSPDFAALPSATQAAILADMEKSVDERFLPITEDTMPGELSNVVAGRVANVFNVNGANFTVDAACASSIAAIDNAVNGLRMGNYDMAITGGVDQMMSAAAFVKFCKIGALSADGSYAFDARANGFVMAEGAGVIILKRLSDAQRDGDKIYGLIRSIGASSDGKGKGITAPNPKGQKLAIEKTFEQLDYTPGEVGLLEAHGTATSVGDAAELSALNEVFAPTARPQSIWLGSVKSQIGHAKAAAGIASVIKVLLALHNKTLPPSINFETPNPTVDWASSPFKVITKAQPWPDSKARRANVSSFGFGGTNFHLAAQEYDPAVKFEAPKCEPPAAQIVPDLNAQENKMTQEYSLMVPLEKLQGDMLVFSGADKQDLINELNQAARAALNEPAYLTRASYKNHTAPVKDFAVAINAEDPLKLKEKIEFFIKTATGADVWAVPSLHLKMKGIYPFHPSAQKPKVCFMFPGQGAQYVDMMKDLASKYKIVKDTFDEADAIVEKMIGHNLTDTLWSKPGDSKERMQEREEMIKQTQFTQPAILTADVAMMRLLYQFGLTPDVVMGHSLGEYGAAVAAGIFDFPNAIKAVSTRGTAMANVKVADNGKMAAVSAAVDVVEPELQKIPGYVAVANKNCPTQTVIAGETKSVEEAVAKFSAMGIQAVIVPVSHAFHSAIVRPAEEPYRAFLDTLTFNAPKLPISSNVTAQLYPSDTAQIKDLMVSQIMSSVEWIAQIKNAYDSGVRLFVEVGPKRVLSAFVTNTLADKKDIRVLSSNHPKKGGITEFNDLMANLAAAGIAVDWSKTNLDDAGGNMYNPAFFEAVGGVKPAPVAAAPAVAAPAAAPVNLDEAKVTSEMLELIAEKTGYPQDMLDLDLDMEADLGIDTVKQAELFAAMRTKYNLPQTEGIQLKDYPTIRSCVRYAMTAAAAPAPVAVEQAPAPVAEAPAPVAPAPACADTDVVISGIAAGTPGSWKQLFEDGNLDAILSGKNFIESLDEDIQKKQINKNIEYVVKSRVGNHRVEKLQDISQSVKLAARKGSFNLEKEFGMPSKWVKSMDGTFTLAIAAGMLALKDAGIPLVQYYKPTSTGGYLPDRWGLPEGMIDDTGVIFTSAFPTATSWTDIVATKMADILKDKTKAQAEAFYRHIIAAIIDENLKAQITAWFNESFGEYIDHKSTVFPQDFLLKTIPIAHSQFCQWIRARGPATHISGACASTAQALALAQDWIKLGRAKRVIVIAADDVTSDILQEWILAGFLASGAISKEADVTKAALPFDKRRNGMIVGMGAAGIVVEAAGEVAKRAMAPLTRLLAAEMRNSAFHPTRLDVNHVAEVMGQMMSAVEQKYNLKREDMAKEMVFISHETYTPARGGSASAEVFALKNTFHADVKEIIVSNVKGFTGHSMGAGLEDVIAVHSLSTGNVPPIANYKEPDPELTGITLSQGGHYNFKYALRLAAGFGSQLAMTLQEKLWAAGTPRINDAARHTAWLKEISHQDNPVLEVVNNTLRIKDNYQAGKKPALVMEASQAFVDKAEAAHAAVAPAPAPVAVVAPAAPVVDAPAPVVAPAAPAPAVPQKLDEAKVTSEMIDLIAEKTGYPQDMLDLDLDMEADLGIDTVKQAELFAAMRTKYNLPQTEGIQLKDYPTIRSCVRYAVTAAEGGVQQPAPAPIAEVAPAAPAPAAPQKLDEAKVTSEMIDLIAEKTGYPQDMLDLDLDMEADLGIDTVKQAELFAAMRTKYNLPQTEGIQLKDYPTIRSCVRYAVTAAEGGAPQSAPAPAPVVEATLAPVVETSAPVAPAPVVETAPAPQDLDEGKVTSEMIDMIAEKTGYPQDMLDLDLDMEADLGIDTVKQAELFAAMRAKYNLPQTEGIQLKDYPTIRSCVRYAITAAAAQTPDNTPVEPVITPEQPVNLEPLASEPPPAAQPAQEPKAYEGEDSHNRKLRFIPTLASAPLAGEASRKLSPNRTVVIMSDIAPLTKAYVEAFKQQGVKTHVFTTLKTRSKNTTIVNWDSLEETTAALNQYAQENPGDVQGIVYLLPCSIKKYDKKSNPHADLTRYLMPLFMACKAFVGDLKNRAEADTFLSVIFRVDGAYGYKTKEAISPAIGSVCGGATCFRKDLYEIGGVLGKIMDFEPAATPEYMAQKTLHEILNGDERAMVTYHNDTRGTILSLPSKLNKSVKYMDLKGKTVAFTGAGRGLGAMLSQKIAAQYGSRVLILDIIDQQSENAAYWATLNEAELKELKNQLWAKLKADTTVRATPVLLERSFGKITDAITLYKNMQKIKALGGEAEYYQCDVTNGSMVKDVVTKIKAKYGKVDGLIHFAGIEKSKLLTDKTTEEYYRTFDIKATSAAAFVALNFVKDSGFYAFASSIAGKYGNLGQSDYASANDYLSKLCISLQNQGQRALSVDMSAYSAVGMGVRSGVFEFLTSQGLKFVDPHDGMQIFLDEIVYGRRPEIVLTDDLGRLDWDGQIRLDDDFVEELASPGGALLNGDGEPVGAPEEPGEKEEDDGAGTPPAPALENAPDAATEAPSQPEDVALPKDGEDNFFLGSVKTLAPGKELFAEHTFSAQYPFLFDHAIEGTPYVPGVMGIETFMEAATLLGGKKPQGLEDVHFYLPIKLLRRNPQAVRIKGGDDNGKISMEIDSDFINSKGIKMGNTRRHFTARVMGGFESKWNEYKDKYDLTAPYAVDRAQIYARYFHGPSFQVLDGIIKLDEGSVLAVYKKPAEVLFHDGPKNLLAHPMLIEAAFQTCGYRDLAVDNRMTLPDSIGKVAVLGDGVAPQKLYMLGVFTGQNIEGKSVYNAFVFDENGKLWIELQDYQMIGQ